MGATLAGNEENGNYLEEARGKLQTMTMPVQRFHRRGFGKYSYTVEEREQETFSFDDLHDYEIDEAEGFMVDLPDRINTASTSMIMFQVVFCGIGAISLLIFCVSWICYCKQTGNFLCCERCQNSFE